MLTPEAEKFAEGVTGTTLALGALTHLCPPASRVLKNQNSVKLSEWNGNAVSYVIETYSCPVKLSVVVNHVELYFSRLFATIHNLPNWHMDTLILHSGLTSHALGAVALHVETAAGSETYSGL